MLTRSGGGADSSSPRNSRQIAWPSGCAWSCTCSWSSQPANCLWNERSPCSAGGLSRSSGSLATNSATSILKPSTPRSQPEARDVEHRVADVRVAPVQVRHLREEDVQPVLPRALVPRPCRPAPDRDPVVRRATVRRGIAPDVPVAVRIVARRARCLEPRVVAGRVVRDVVHDHRQAELVCAREERVEVRERAEARVDVGVVGDVVAEVAHRRAVERREPDRVDAEPREVLEPRRDAREVADPVGVGVGERARVDLVDDARLPPGPVSA